MSVLLNSSLQVALGLFPLLVFMSFFMGGAVLSFVLTPKLLAALTDRAKHAVLQISKFGLIQITRQRMKPEMNINTSEICPGCNGSGKISSTLILEDEIEKNLSYLIMQNHKGLTIEVNPILFTFLTSGIISRRRKWSWKYKQKIKVVSKSTYHLTEFRFFDHIDEEIKL